MRFNEFINKLYEAFPCSNQGQFVLEIFSALCGETNPAAANQESSNKAKEFRCSDFLPSGLTGYDPTYRKRLFSGGKKYRGLSGPIKTHIQRHKNKETFIAYCNSAISFDAFPKLCDSFGLPVSLNRAVVFEGLYEQFIEFAISQNDDVSFILPDVINRLQNNPPNNTEVNTTEDFSPLYPGDDILLLSEFPEGHHQVTFYEIFNHQWTIKNIGKITWTDRFFEFTNRSATRIRPTETRIAIPTTAPGDEVTLTATIDARHFEGTFEAIWEMKDRNGRLCFPDKSKALKLVAIVANIPDTTAEDSEEITE